MHFVAFAQIKKVFNFSLFLDIYLVNKSRCVKSISVSICKCKTPNTCFNPHLLHSANQKDRPTRLCKQERSYVYRNAKCPPGK